jgi:hypothetical protein
VELAGDSFFFEYHRSRQSGVQVLTTKGATGEDKHKGKKVVGYWEDG